MHQADSIPVPVASCANLPIAARLGRATQRNPRVITRIQWTVVALYLFLLLVPVLLPLPGPDAHILDNLSLLARFLFWGVGWPLIMLSMMLFGRVWCGLFCPDGTLTEYVSRRGRKRSIPRWIRWSGWPLVMLAGTTVYGQLVGVYEFAPATLLLLGLPTLGALLTGFLYGNGKRVWCMYLCPANGVFSLLAKIAPLHFRVDQEQWKRHSGPPPRIDCAPLVNIRQMKSASACHACGRCGGYTDAVDLAVRAPDREILASGNRDVTTAEALVLLFGVIGICTAAMQWAGHPLFILLQSALPDWLSRIGALALSQPGPWWVLANYPELNAVYGLNDGLCMLIFMVGGGSLLGLVALATVWLAASLADDAGLRWQRLALGLIPAAGIGLFLGLSTLTVKFLRMEGLALQWVAPVQAILLAAGSLFSFWLGARLILTRLSLRRLLATAVFMLPVALLQHVWAVRLFA